MARLSLRPRCQIGEVSERFAELRRMGIRTLMITGDNAMTAAAIAAEAGVDDFRAGDHLVRRIVKTGEREVKFSPKEYELLRVLVQHAGKVLTHRFLLKELWDELTDAQCLRVYVRQLRQKIEADPERPQFVLTETGIGYRLRAPD